MDFIGGKAISGAAISYVTVPPLEVSPIPVISFTNSTGYFKADMIAPHKIGMFFIEAHFDGDR